MHHGHNNISAHFLYNWTLPSPCLAWTACTVKSSAKAPIQQQPASPQVLLPWLQDSTGMWIKTFKVNACFLLTALWRRVCSVNWGISQQLVSYLWDLTWNVSSDLTGQYLPEETWSAPSIPLTNEFRYNTTEALPYIPQPPTTASYNG